MFRTRKRKNGFMGGKMLYKDASMITEEEIERVFCNGKRMEDLPTTEKPVFVYKWGPPGSGKSSSKVLGAVEQIGYPLDNYVNVDIDQIYESLMPFRFMSSLAKTRELRTKANYSNKDYVLAKQFLLAFLNSASAKSANPQLLTDIQGIISGWETGQPLSSANHAKLESLLETVTGVYTVNFFRYYQDTWHIKEKLRSVMRKAFRLGKHILYESTGSGYKTQQETDLFLRDPQLGRTRRSTRQGMIDLYKNPKEAMLGKILYKDEFPVGYTMVSEDTIPEFYKIYVICPILQKDLILQRAQTRAMQGLFESPAYDLPSDPALRAEYLKEYKRFLDMLLNSIGKGANQINAMVRETSDYQGSFTNYLQDLRRKANDPLAKSLPAPFYRGFSSSRLEDIIDQAFQYSIDYFLKQYMIIGRIEQIMYVNTL
jgi:hypothetical protein